MTHYHDCIGLHVPSNKIIRFSLTSEQVYGESSPDDLIDAYHDNEGEICPMWVILSDILKIREDK